MDKSLRSKVVISVVLGVIVMLGLALFSDIGKVGDSLSTFNWLMLPAVLGFTIFNYVLRWLKWDYYLRKLGQGTNVSYGQSALLFTAGMVMAVTPGKVGEVLKSGLLKRLNGTPISRSAPIVLAERLTDGLAMLLLMATGLALYPPARPAFVVLVILSVLGLALFQNRRIALGFIGWLERGRLARFAKPLHSFYESSAELLSGRLLVVSTIISVVSWAGECVAMYYVLRGFGAEASGSLLLQSTFIFAASTLFGLVSFLPGGLGASEVSSTLLITTLVKLGEGAATAATIVIRFCTLWFGVLLGIVAMSIFAHRYGLIESEATNLAKEA
ncbi:MAG: flippase-like domain-containing protein [Chloroflexi bacterium]|nr:flippase-like domain-containing protein [Chloroflexota bacterium]